MLRHTLVHSMLIAGAILVACSDQNNPSFPGSGGEQDAGDEETPTIEGDPTKGILFKGTVIGENGPFEGQVLTLADGTIACAEPGEACGADPAASGVAKVTIDGIIAPGLIDAHNHILFDVFDDSDWLPSKVYTNHEDWTKNTNEPRYTVMVDVKQCLEDASQGKPTWCPAKYDGAGNLKCEMEKWGELKGLVAGTTSIVGLAGTASACFGSLARSIDTAFNGLPEDKMQTAAILPSKSSADGVCNNFTSGKTTAYLIHVGEGTDQKARDELTDIGTLTTAPNCLYAAQTAVTHGTSFGAAEISVMQTHGMKLTWSPASNVALYGATTNIPAMLDAGILVSLGPDWSMGGSQNMLDELTFAKKWSDSHFNGRLSAKDVFTMATANGATTIGLGNKIGTIKKGYLADLFIVGGDRKAPYDTIVAATPKNVRLTMVGGKVLYGDTALKPLAAFGTACENFDACGEAKFLCVADPSKTNDKLNQSYAEIKTVLEAAMTDMDSVRPVGVGGNFAPLAPTVACKAK